MTFKFTISRPQFAVEFEAGSISEAIGIFQAEGTEFAKLFAINFGPPAQGVVGEGPRTGEPTTETTETTARRPRRPRGAGADPSTAAAPAPIDVPGETAPPTVPTATVDMTPNANGIPAGLVRDANNAAPVMAAAAPPPPPAPPAPLAPPAAPPTGVLGGKIATELDRRATGAADGGQALADWLVQCGICVKGATYKEATDVLRLQPDEKLTAIAAQLGVA